MAAPRKRTHHAVTGGGSALTRYQQVMVGRSGIGATLYFEFCSWLSPVPGALGLLLRKWFWPRLFHHCGRSVVFGAGVVLRHPSRIALGDRVVISEGCVLDGRNANRDCAIDLGDDVMLANHVLVSSKDGMIRIGSRTGLGAQTIVQSLSDCPVTIGEDALVGPRCYLVAGGGYRIDDPDTLIREQGTIPDSGVSIADNVWLGGGVTVLGGVEMGEGSVAAAGAVVVKTVDAGNVVAGVPARTIRTRT